jgi:hypothetical protein
MVCANVAFEERFRTAGDVDPMVAPAHRLSWYFGDRPSVDDETPVFAARESAEANDPFDDFEDDDFDDEFDDDFEEDWEDDLTEDDEFPDTFGGADEPDEAEPVEDSPFADDPDFDDA